LKFVFNKILSFFPILRLPGRKSQKIRVCDTETKGNDIASQIETHFSHLPWRQHTENSFILGKKSFQQKIVYDEIK